MVRALATDIAGCHQLATAKSVLEVSWTSEYEEQTSAVIPRGRAGESGPACLCSPQPHGKDAFRSILLSR